MINTIISNLPDVYHALSERDKQIKLRNTDYNRFLVEKLKDADYISLYSIKKKRLL